MSEIKPPLSFSDKWWTFIACDRMKPADLLACSFSRTKRKAQVGDTFKLGNLGFIVYGTKQMVAKFVAEERQTFHNEPERDFLQRIGAKPNDTLYIVYYRRNVRPAVDEDLKDLF